MPLRGSQHALLIAGRALPPNPPPTLRHRPPRSLIDSNLALRLHLFWHFHDTPPPSNPPIAPSAHSTSLSASILPRLSIRKMMRSVADSFFRPSGAPAFPVITAADPLQPSRYPRCRETPHMRSCAPQAKTRWLGTFTGWWTAHLVDGVRGVEGPYSKAEAAGDRRQR